MRLKTELDRYSKVSKREMSHWGEKTHDKTEIRHLYVEWRREEVNYWHVLTANLRQGGRHGCFPSHAVSNENAFLDVQLSKKMLQIISHRFISQHRAVRAGAMVTSIYSQHLTRQRTVRGTWNEGEEATEHKTKTSQCVDGETVRQQRLYCAL